MKNEALVTVRRLAERYDVSMKTARSYMRRINPHMENPLTTYEWALLEWEKSRTVNNDNPAPARRKSCKAEPVERRNGRVWVPRKR